MEALLTGGKVAEFRGCEKKKNWGGSGVPKLRVSLAVFESIAPRG